MIASAALSKRSLLLRRWTLPVTPSVVTTAATHIESKRFHSSSPKNSSGSSFLDSAAETVASLRWKIATSLTQSLSKDEQQELLGRLTVNDPQTTKASKEAALSKEKEDEAESEQLQQHSIAEAVAAAKAQESQEQSAKWEKEKDKIRAEAERAAKARVESEISIQHRRMKFEQWQRELAEKREKDDAQVEIVDGSTAVEKDKTSTSRSLEEEPVAISDHPVLGSAVADLGYKRVHIASVSALNSLPVWEKQRTYRHQRAKAMASDKMKTLHLGMPGIIALHEDKSGKLSIIDGQHRVGMMTILEEQKQGATDKDSFFDLDRILVEVYPETTTTNNNNNNNSTAHAQDIFLEINKAEPVKLVDLPGIALTKAARSTINGGATRLQEAFPEMFKESQRCRAPHLNIDNLRDALFASDVVKRHGLKSPKALLDWMMEQNERLKKEYTSADSAKASSISQTALDKAIKFDFYLGLDSSWFYF